MLELHNLQKSFGDVTALEDVTFTASPGETLGFLGRNGAGKTTTMRAIFKLLRLDSGTVTWNGTPISRDDLKRFGYMPEERGLYQRMTCRSQLVYLGRLHGMSKTKSMTSADHWLELLGLTDRANDKIETLSQGNQQRVQLASALLHEPELVVLDEPFNGLDPVAADTMATVLEDQAMNGATVVFSSHQLETVEALCKNVTIIDHGKTLTTGDLQQLCTELPWRVVELELTASQADTFERHPGVRDVLFNGRTSTLTVDVDLDIRQVLDTLPAEETIHHFVYRTPSLTDLFRNVTATEPTSPGTSSSSPSSTKPQQRVKPGTEEANQEETP